MKSYFTTRHLLLAVTLVGLAAAMHFGYMHEPSALGLLAFGVTAQMQPSAARVIDPILTTVAQGYKNNEFVGMNLFPSVPVMQRGGKILTFGKEDFAIYDTRRAPGAATKRVQIGYSGAAFSLEDHSLEGLAPVELMQEAQAVPGIDLGRATVNKVQNIIGLRLEKAQADLATTTANYQTANKLTSLASTTLWSDATASTPITDIETGKEAIRAATGRRPNTLVIGPLVMKALRVHSSIIDRIKYTGRDVPTPELLAALFGLQRVLVGDAIYTDASGAFVDVWGKNAILAYTETGSVADQGLPSYGYTYRLSGYPIVERPYYDENPKSWLYPVTDVVSPVIASASGAAGYLISPAVA